MMSFKLGTLGIWANIEGCLAHFEVGSSLESGPASSQKIARFVSYIEALGYSALWIPEALGRNSLVHASWLLANSKSLVVATGIANIYARDPMAMAAARSGLNEQSSGRFVLGLGVSHSMIVEGMRGHHYGKPVATMRAYLDAMNAALYHARPPDERPVTVLGALRDRMISLAAELTDGAHPLNVTPEHTARARQILGPDKLLCVEQKLVLESDPAAARAIGRKALEVFLPLENYRNSLKEMGFSDDEFSGGGSNRLVDAIVGWGDEAALRGRIQQHLDAGATQVCFHPLSEDGGIDTRIIELLSPNRF